MHRSTSGKRVVWACRDRCLRAVECQSVHINQRKFPEGANWGFEVEWLLEVGGGCSRQDALKGGGG